MRRRRSWNTSGALARLRLSTGRRWLTVSVVNSRQFHGPRPEDFVLYRLGYDDEMPLGYRGLEVAGAKNMLKQMDWKTRVLECLFVEGTNVPHSKDHTLTELIVRLVRIESLTTSQPRQWFSAQHQHRKGTLCERIWMLDNDRVHFKPGRVYHTGEEALSVIPSVASGETAA